MSDTALTESQLPEIDVIYAGGTISSLLTAEGYRVGGHAFRLTSLLEMPEPPTLTIGFEEVRYAGLSENMLPADQANVVTGMLAAIERGHSSVTTHGTDSMVQMTRYTDRSVGKAARAKGVRVILTGANEDMEHPETDTWENLGFALEQAANDSVAPGVYVAFHANLIPAMELVRLPYIPSMRPTFVSNKSAEYRQALSEQQQTIKRQQEALLQAFDHAPDPGSSYEYPVNVIRLDHQNFLNDVIADQRVKCVLLRLYHSGTANTDKPQQSVAELVNALRTTRPDLVFFGATENGEPTDLRLYETSVQMRKAGVVPLYDMLHNVAATKLTLLSPELSPRQRIQAMLENKVGEIDPVLVRKHQADIKQLLELYKD